MKILGIDPSLTSTGLVLVEGGQVTKTQRVRSKRKGHDRVEEILYSIHDLIMTVDRKSIFDAPNICSSIRGCKCDIDIDAIGIEGTAFNAKGSSVVQIFGLWGVITHQLYQWGIDYYVVPPSNRVKYATGKGNSSKDEVLAAVVRRYPSVPVVGNDVADALLVAAIGARQFSQPLEDTLPASHLKALEGVQWTNT